MKKALRVRLAAIEQAGLSVVAVDVTGAKHIKARVATADGRTALVVLGRSPPDAGCGLRAFRGQLRRLIAQRPMMVRQ